MFTLPAASRPGASAPSAERRASSQITRRPAPDGDLFARQHDNRTRSLAWPAVVTDLEVESAARVNQPFSFTRDLFKGRRRVPRPGSIRATAGLTTTAAIARARKWRRHRKSPAGCALRRQAGEQPVGVAQGAACPASRHYGSVSWISPAENPLMRKFNMAARVRDAAAGAGHDTAVGDNVNLSFSVDYAWDRYNKSSIGLTSGVDHPGWRTFRGADRRRVRLSADRIDRARRAPRPPHHRLVDGSQPRRDAGRRPGLMRHGTEGQTRDQGPTSPCRTGCPTCGSSRAAPGFPTARSRSMDQTHRCLKLQDNVSVVAIGASSNAAPTRHTDGVTPSNVPGLLALGDQASRYHSTCCTANSNSPGCPDDRQRTPAPPALSPLNFTRAILGSFWPPRCSRSQGWA